ncbi:molybdopterin-dependent oxidoreductase iron-sulfur protein [Motilibacter rhizosphaerae]|uniref:Molybdopterin-dependent oxidoreductase iron-sulfur protein n=1 Tax=Motilibacter rhizosphaerae TaxID=598652 RepID=A0A4Q7NFR1_9ACTN|nr:nitrate reductase [Motilibacter rhizosphaerae]RZS82730.1 molybdopterin-dependent oxidoreductase iron-sulfur protein [Motilibacter rhizosphaerae]
MTVEREVSVDRIEDPWGLAAPHPQGTPWSVRQDLWLEPGTGEDAVERWVPSACVLCSNGCGCEIAVAGGRMVGVRGRASDPVNLGRLGPKGLFASTPWSHSRERLSRPLLRKDGELVEVGWDEAMDAVVQASRRVLAEKGPLGMGFYTSGQLMLEEYYALGVIGKAGIGTPHMDGNTRLCTATAAASLKESFGTDGQPGTYDDIEHCDALFLWGHNVAETQTVLWRRMLDRLEAPDRPALVLVDPRETPVAAKADVHLRVLPGTNQALMLGLTRELLHHGWWDEAWVQAHTIGLEEMRSTVEPWTLDRTAEVCGVPAAEIAHAARIFGTRDRVLSTVLQGFYQSHQATAASVAVNNLHLLRAMIGRPGAGVLQMNGQPTAQNNRECGADGDLPAFRNWSNEEHVRQLAELWNVEPSTIPHWAPPTHAMQIWRYAEQGSIGFLWISATNPAVSLPELPRIREILQQDRLFTVVNDGFLTETAELADVVLPSAMWGEKTGTFTNASRYVHLAQQAVEPYGESRSDLDIWLDYARRMDFRDKDGQPLIPWQTPEDVFEAWKECSKGRPCDYSGLTYERLAEGPVQWPVTAERPSGTARLYPDAHFGTDTDYAESWGQDLETGASTTEEQHKAMAPAGRAFLRVVDHSPPPEVPSAEFPLVLTTGRTVYHFHTRTKTGRARQLREAAPRVWVELSAEDAESAGVAAGQRVRVESPRGALEAEVRIGRTRTGVVFIPWHYGQRKGEPHTAANELTITAWDPVSKQPLFKIGACRVRPLEEG